MTAAADIKLYVQAIFYFSPSTLTVKQLNKKNNNNRTCNDSLSWIIINICFGCNEEEAQEDTEVLTANVGIPAT